MGNLFLLSERRMARISPYFPLAHGTPRVDDRRVVSGIASVIRNGLQWKDAPKAYGPYKTLYNRFMRWSIPDLLEHDAPWTGLIPSGLETAMASHPPSGAPLAIAMGPLMYQVRAAPKSQVALPKGDNPF